MANVTTGGEWSAIEKDRHINYLQIRAVLFGLQSLCREISNAHVNVMTDNATAVAYINNIGGSHSSNMIWLQKYGNGA